MSKAVDVKIRNVLGANLARSLVEHVNIYTVVWVNPWLFFFRSSLLLFLGCFLSSLPILITQTVCCSIATVVCYSYRSAFLLLQRNCEQQDKDSQSTCLHFGEAVGGGDKKVADTMWRAKGWLIGILTEIIAVVFFAVSRGLWMWDGSRSNLETRWGQRSSLGRTLPAAANKAEVVKYQKSSLLGGSGTSNKPAQGKD